MRVQRIQQVDRLLRRRYWRPQILKVLMQLLQTLHVHVEVLCLRLNDSAQQCLRICDLDRTLHLVECPQGIPHSGSCSAVRDVRQLRRT